MQTAYIDGYLNSTNRFITNELWLVDNTKHVSGFYNANPFIKVGIRARLGFQEYFWTDLRTQDRMVNDHPSVTVPSGDFGTNPYFGIYWITTNTYDVIVSSDNYPNQVFQSVNNNMSVYEITIGQEIYPDTGGYATGTSLNNNRWISGGSYNYQTSVSNLSYVIDNPPEQAGWAQDPAHSSTGGDWRTYCPCGS